MIGLPLELDQWFSVVQINPFFSLVRTYLCIMCKVSSTTGNHRGNLENFVKYEVTNHKKITQSKTGDLQGIHSLIYITLSNVLEV